MARGYPDYNNPVYSIAAKNIDFGLLAAAIMGVTPVDGRGRPIYWDHFQEGLLAWNRGFDGDALEPYAATVLPFAPPVCAVFEIGTLAGLGSCLLSRQIYLASSNRVGFEVSVSLSSFTQLVKLIFTWDNGTERLIAQLEYDPSTELIQVLTPTGLVTVGSTAGYPFFGAYKVFKLVADFTTKTYSHLIVVQHNLDLSGYDLSTAASQSIGRCLYEVVGTALGAASRTQYIGHIILTIDEP